MPDASRQTIFALSSGAGRAGVAVIRVSGPEAGAALAALSGQALPAPRQAALVRLADPASGELLDHGLALWFPAPASYTGEDVAEFHVHGGRAVIDGVLDALAACPGLRPAEPGEFTRRAFGNDRMDLTAAEGIADLVDAETAAQRRQALRQSEGALAGIYDQWRSELLKILAYYETEMDFSDENLPAEMLARLGPEIEALRAAISAHLDDGHRGERLREGFYIAIVGAPNVGKSSLLNRLARREAAIVSASAGTTRDVVECHLDLGGYPVILADTAGLRAAGVEAAADPVEREGIRRAQARAAAADLRLAVFEAGASPDAATAALVDGATLVVLNKADLMPELGRGAGPDVVPDVVPDVGPPEIAGQQGLALSALTGDGVEALVERLEAEVAARIPAGDAPALTRARHRQALEDCAKALGRAQEAALPELAAEDLRLAMRALGRITGRVDVEELLDLIFRDFCIGK